MRVFQTEIGVREGQSGVLVFTLRDEAGELVEKAALDSILLDLYRWHGDVATVINGRDQQNVLDAHDGEYFDTLQSTVDEDGNTVQFNFRWRYTPDDTPFLGADTLKLQTEVHIAHFRFLWDAGAKSIPHEVKMVVTNFRRFAIEEAS